MRSELDKHRERLDGDRRPLFNTPEIGKTYSIGRGSPVTTLKGNNGVKRQVTGRLTQTLEGVLTEIHSGKYGLTARAQSAMEQSGTHPHIIQRGDLVWVQSEHMQRT